MADEQKPVANSKKGFSLVELLIVVAILGILAAMALPTFQGHIQQAKEAAAKDNLRILRETIERYASKHGVPPGYINNNSNGPASGLALITALLADKKYLNDFPENPFNKLNNFRIIQNAGTIPVEPTGSYGWVYQPCTKTIKLDWTGNDSTGVPYYSY